MALLSQKHNAGYNAVGCYCHAYGRPDPNHSSVSAGLCLTILLSRSSKHVLLFELVSGSAAIWALAMARERPQVGVSSRTAFEACISAKECRDVVGSGH